MARPSPTPPSGQATKKITFFAASLSNVSSVGGRFIDLKLKCLELKYVWKFVEEFDKLASFCAAETYFKVYLRYQLQT